MGNPAFLLNSNAKIFYISTILYNKTLGFPSPPRDGVGFFLLVFINIRLGSLLN
jgi:hypothetical protein